LPRPSLRGGGRHALGARGLHDVSACSCSPFESRRRWWRGAAVTVGRGALGEFGANDPLPFAGKPSRARRRTMPLAYLLSSTSPDQPSGGRSSAEPRSAGGNLSSVLVFRLLLPFFPFFPLFSLICIPGLGSLTLDYRSSMPSARRDGSCLLLLGPNEAGKTTLLARASPGGCPPRPRHVAVDGPSARNDPGAWARWTARSTVPYRIRFQDQRLFSLQSQQRWRTWRSGLRATEEFAAKDRTRRPRPWLGSSASTFPSFSFRLVPLTRPLSFVQSHLFSPHPFLSFLTTRCSCSTSLVRARCEHARRHPKRELRRQPTSRSRRTTASGSSSTHDPVDAMTPGRILQGDRPREPAVCAALPLAELRERRPSRYVSRRPRLPSTSYRGAADRRADRPARRGRAWSPPYQKPAATCSPVVSPRAVLRLHRHEPGWKKPAAKCAYPRDRPAARRRGR